MYERKRAVKILYKLKSAILKERYQPTALQLDAGDGFEDYDLGNYFGHKNQYYDFEGYFNLEELPNTQDIQISIYTHLGESDNSTNPQMMLYLAGKPYQSFDVNHQSIEIPEQFLTKDKLEFKINLFSGREEKKFPVYVFLDQIDQPTKKAFWDLKVLIDSWEAVEDDESLNILYEKAIIKIINQLDFRQIYSKDYYESLANASGLMDTFYQQQDYPAKEITSVVGHTHIDLGWLWTVEQAIEKGEKSLLTALNFMNKYDEFTFIHSQPQLYAFIKERYPYIYQEIQRYVAEGRWEVEGAMWVESDTNLPNGESLVRQLLYGKKFFKEEFDRDSEILWLPDVFGYSPVVPQLLNKTNTKYFMTTKLSWNQYNQIPYDTFYWQGIDGSKVITHLITTISKGYSPTPFYTTYNGEIDPYTVMKSWERYQQKRFGNENLIAYGYGDGGGGPTEAMIEIADRLQNGLPGIPKVQNSFALDFFKRLEDKAETEVMPTWSGELYFEFHRGTYTSIGKIKKQNRIAEYQLQTLEKLAIIFNRDQYPHSIIEKMWKKVLLNQFHDILPGSAIKEVYDQTDQDYSLVSAFYQDLLNQFFPSVAQDTSNEQSLFLFNPLDFTRGTYLVVDGGVSHATTASKQPVQIQLLGNNQSLIYIQRINGYAYDKLFIEYGAESSVVTSKKRTIKPDEVFSSFHYDVTFNSSGQIISLFDCENQREVLPEGSLFNQLVAYEDIPMDYDAWDIDYYYKEKHWEITQLESMRIVEDGPLTQVIEFSWKYLNSLITQQIIFYQKTRRIDFQTEVDWQENQTLLKAQFPIDVNTQRATFDIQYGNIERNIHENTSWERAQFEVSAQKWVDLSEGDYGVSVMSDSKYGYNVDYQNIGITLIKSPINPYPEADIGHHSFTYAVYPHKGNWKESRVMQEALDLNYPVLAKDNVALNTNSYYLEMNQSWISHNKDNVLIDTVKIAENRDGIVLRAFEFQNSRTTVTFEVSEAVESVSLCNLLEEEIEVIPVINQSFTVTFNPYEIHTLLIR